MDPSSPVIGSLARMSLLALLIALATNQLSAWIRHGEAGLDCSERAHCYGMAALESSAAAGATRDARETLAPSSGAKRLHRVLATGLVFICVWIMWVARIRARLGGSGRRLPMLVLWILVVLSINGPFSHLKSIPLIAWINIFGGLVLAAVLWKLQLLLRPPGAAARPMGTRTRTALLAALVALWLQLALGAWTSANFAGLACEGPPGCATTALLGEAEATLAAFSPLRRIGQDGMVGRDTASRIIQLGHRVCAGLAALLLLYACLRCMRNEPGLVRIAAIVLALLALQLSLGIAMLYATLPLALVLAHNGIATLLLLASMRLRAIPDVGAQA